MDEYKIKTHKTEEGSPINFPLVDSEGVGLQDITYYGRKAMAITFEVQGKIIGFVLDQNDCINLVSVLQREIPHMVEANKKAGN